MVNSREAYPIDMGLIPVRSDRSGNVGHALEPAVLLELERRGLQRSYIRTADGFEVDFLVRYPGKGGREELIQVCSDLDEINTRDRDPRALVAAGREPPGVGLRLISL